MGDGGRNFVVWMGKVGLGGVKDELKNRKEWK